MGTLKANEIGLNFNCEKTERGGGEQRAEGMAYRVKGRGQKAVKGCFKD